MNVSPKAWAGKILFAFGGLIVLVMLFYAEEDLRGMFDWNSYKGELKARGQKFGWMAFVPAAVPDDQNFAMSSVWVASIKYFLGKDTHKLAQAWYGDRINDEDVSNFLDLMLVTPSALTGADLTGQDWTSKLPPTPDLQPGWTSGRRVNLKPWQSYYRDLKKANPAEISLATQPQSPAADVLQALSKYDPVIAQLRQDSQKPDSRFPVQYNTDDPGDIWLPHLSILKECAEVLELRAIAELQNGQTDRAADDAKLILRLADSTRTEPFIITHLVRMVTMQMAIQIIYEGLAEHQWTDAQLAGFDSELAKVDFPADFQFSVNAECAADIKIYQWFEQKRSRCWILFEWNNQKFKAYSLATVAFYLAPAGWFYQADIRRARQAQYLDSAMADDDSGRAVISPTKVSQASRAVKTLAKSPGPLFELFWGIDLTPFARRTAYAQASADLARVAIALERYYLALGVYPNSLDVLAPRFMPEVPSDVINGGPLHYRVTPDRQFVLYSVGWNERDDGGHSFAGSAGGAGNLERGDWVWRYPKE